MIQTLLRSLAHHSISAATAVLGVVGVAALIGEYGHRQITHAHRNDFRDDPDRWGLGPAEEIALTARDGIKLHSWLFRSPSASASVIVLHGHGGNKHTCLPLARMLYPDFNVLLLDHRGHGESGGHRTTIGYEERMDVHAAVDVLTERGLGPVGIFGMSMGAATAILAAAEDPRILAVVADSPYARLRWAVQQSAVLRGYPASLTPSIAFLGCLTTALHLRHRMQAFDPVEVIERIAPRPLLLMHGVEDEIIPVASAHALFARAHEPKDLWLIDGLKHCRAVEEAFEPFQQRVRGFFNQWLRVARTATPNGTAHADGRVVSG
jgi:alpha-beta hydrolase superfamily lysophospholipase